MGNVVTHLVAQYLVHEIAVPILLIHHRSFGNRSWATALQMNSWDASNRDDPEPQGQSNMERPEWGSGRDGNIFESRENDGCHWEVENQDDEDIQEAVNRQSSTLPLNPLKIMHLVHFSINLLPFTCIRTLDFSSGWVSSILKFGSHVVSKQSTLVDQQKFKRSELQTTLRICCVGIKTG